jgi:hypothetical protein
MRFLLEIVVGLNLLVYGLAQSPSNEEYYTSILGERVGFIFKSDVVLDQANVAATKQYSEDDSSKLQFGCGDYNTGSELGSFHAHYHFLLT